MTIDPYTLTSGNVPVEKVIADRITVTIIPTMREALKDVRELDELWDINGMTDKVAAAAQADTPLADYAPEDWQAWSTVFNALLVFLATPIESIGKSPLQVLGKWYTKVSAE